MGEFIMSYKDYGQPGEIGTVALHGADLTAANIVNQTTLWDTLRTALEAITLGGIQKRQLVAWVNETKVEPSDPFAQREMKWIIYYHDTANTSIKQRCELPCADLQFLDPNNSDKALMTDPAILAFVAAFEAVVLSSAGNAVKVDRINFVGRNS